MPVLKEKLQQTQAGIKRSKADNQQLGTQYETLLYQARYLKNHYLVRWLNNIRLCFLGILILRSKNLCLRLNNIQINNCF